MTKRYFVGNLKMNPVSVSQADAYLDALREELSGKAFNDTKVIIAPPAVYLERFGNRLPKGISLAAQDTFWEPEGSFTGQISPNMLRDLGSAFVIVGHSERRSYAHETDTEVGQKVRAAIREGLRPIVCVGETADEKEQNETGTVITRQVTEALRDVSFEDIGRIIVAYEPRWAIGTDRTPEREEIREVAILIRKVIDSLRGESGSEVPVLYGGSVKTSLLEKVCFGPGMDGVLVGRDSLIPKEVVAMVAIIDSYVEKGTDGE
ncbi:MAG: triose-phosphate isomerase [Candidatus Moraniibacteriota bacterium]